MKTTYRDYKTRLKIIWLLLTNKYDRHVNGDAGTMTLHTNKNDVDIKIIIKRPKIT